jgi:hypothetical protein
MGRGRPRKRICNFSRVLTRSPTTSDSGHSASDNNQKSPAPPGNSVDHDSEEVLWDRMRWRINEDEEGYTIDDSDDSEVEEVSDIEEFGDDEFDEKMLAFAVEESDDLNDRDWLPHCFPKKKKTGQ